MAHTEDQLVAVLLDWARSWPPHHVTETAVRGPEDRPKRAAWVKAEGDSGFGQVTVWDTGECEIAVWQPRAAAAAQESLLLADPAELIAQLDPFAARWSAAPTGDVDEY